ncbi:hypothetical protein C2G38_2030416 [Gigaspora rosea]|uniref:DDE Tnp4 domain-containing protein n=1 Tax=Gigaspora rosea TaxID=44941 RepID=A0A397VYZ5_9GLOM|nr:hypothetical protein C2G38_2030416 [Gigaspora rosea]
MDIDHDNELSKQLMLYHRLIVAIQSLREEYVLWPREDYQKEINQEFENLGFPIAIGAIDGTHIPLNEAPSKINKEKHNDNWGQDYNDDPIELELEDFELGQ